MADVCGGLHYAGARKMIERLVYTMASLRLCARNDGSRQVGCSYCCCSVVQSQLCAHIYDTAYHVRQRWVHRCDHAMLVKLLYVLGYLLHPPARNKHVRTKSRLRFLKTISIIPEEIGSAPGATLSPYTIACAQAGGSK